MIGKRRSLDLTDYRSVMRSKGDIAVGAYARQQRRQRLLLALAGLVLIVGAVWLYFVLQPADVVDSPRTYPLLVECVKCGHRAVVQVEAGEEAFPLPCPQCGERACHKLWQCRVCGERFLRKGSEAMVRCPKCGSRAVGEAEASQRP